MPTTYSDDEFDSVGSDILRQFGKGVMYKFKKEPTP
jgi:hypothetical protein